jgi:hypothetical protein
MYIAITKNDNNTWDAIYELAVKNGTDLYSLLADEIAKGLPLIGMRVTPYKSKAIRGAVWDGTSFSGGNLKPHVPLDDDEIWTTSEKYSFLSDNKIVVSFTVPNDDSQSEMFKAAFAGETVLVRNISKPLDKVGKTFTLTDDLDLVPVQA